MSASYDQVVAAHRLFCALIERDIPWDMQRLYPWEAFLCKFTTDELRMVVDWIKSRKKQHKPARELTFRSLISGPCALQWFAEDKAQALAELRQRPTPRARALASIGRQEPERKAVRADVVLERTALAEKLRQWKQANL